MGSKQSKPKNEGAVSDASKKQQEEQPFEKVQQAQKQENHYHNKKVKAMDELPTIYVSPGDNTVTVPPGGAQIVFKGQEGQKIDMTPNKPAQPATQTKIITTGGYYGGYYGYPGYYHTRGGVIYSVPKSTVVTKNDDGSTTTSKVVVVSSGGPYYYDPFYGPYYRPYYGYRRYPYYYY